MIPSVLGLAKLARMSFDGTDFAPLWEQLTARFSQDSTDAEARQTMYAALLDMCLIDQMQGNPERGLQFQGQALEECRLYQLPAETQPLKLTVLGFMAAGKINANTPVEFLIENAGITLLLLYIVPGNPLPPVPEHDVALTLISDSDEAKPALLELERLTADWPRLVLNRPSRISRVGREWLYQLLAPIAGVTIPATSRLPRAALLPALAHSSSPVIVRPVDSHAGDGLERLDCTCDAEAYLGQHPETEFYLSPFQDYRSADGLYRKYRIVVIDGKPYPCHMGISDHWMIHYVNAGMRENSKKRREEEAFLDGFQHDFEPRHRQALTEITDALGLDYFGIDCAEMPDGSLLIFEAGTALVVHDMDPPSIFPYKHAHMQAIFTAFQTLLFQK